MSIEVRPAGVITNSPLTGSKQSTSRPSSRSGLLSRPGSNSPQTMTIIRPWDLINSLKRSDLQSFQRNSSDAPVSKTVLGKGLNAKDSISVTVGDLDRNALSLGYLQNGTNQGSIPPEQSPRSLRARMGSGYFIIVENDADISNHEQLLKHPYIYPFKNINPIPEKNSHIDYGQLSQIERLVYGSNSVISSARLNPLGKPVIVKIIKENCKNQKLAESEFEAEHQILCRMNHEHIMGYYGKGSLYQGIVRRKFLVLEWLDGGTLSHLLHQPIRAAKQLFTTRRVLEIAKAFADALHYLHDDFHSEASIIHRDLKPDNIAFTDQGTLKIIDFGLAVCLYKKKTDDETYDMTGNTGSLRYMAPEVILCQPYNEKVDIYSYSIIMWQVATCITPFSNLSREEFVQDIVDNNTRPPLTFPDGTSALPLGLADLLCKCWDVDFNLRLSAQDILLRLDDLITQYSSSSDVDNSTTCSIS